MQYKELHEREFRMEIRNVAVVGVGAVGAVVASKLTAFLGRGHVQCLADGERKERYERDGIFINGVREQFNFVSSDDAAESDLVIVATKNLQLAQAIRMMKNVCGRKTMILSLLNGLQSERDIAEVYGEERVLYGFVISLNSIHEKNQIYCSNYGTVVFGEKNNEKTARIRALENLFRNSGMSYLNPADIHFEMWKKFLINTVFNTVSAVTRSPYGGFKSECMQNVARQVGAEVVSVANAEGIGLDMQMIEDDIRLICSHDPHGKTSMLQDMEAGRKSENEWFCGTVVRLAEKHGISVPLCCLLRNLVEGAEAARNV